MSGDDSLPGVSCTNPTTSIIDKYATNDAVTEVFSTLPAFKGLLMRKPLYHQVDEEEKDEEKEKTRTRRKKRQGRGERRRRLM